MANDHDGNYNRPVGAQTFLTSQMTPSLSNMPLAGEEDLLAEADEPPDEQCSSIVVDPLPTALGRIQGTEYFKSVPPQLDRRESLLTRALMTDSELSSHEEPESIRPSRAMSTRSDQSTSSTISTIDLISDDGITSPARTDTPSPPLPQPNFAGLTPLASKTAFDNQIIIGHDGKDQNLPILDLKNAQETAVEADLGRRRCISFTCGRRSTPAPTTAQARVPKEDPHVSVASPAPAAPPKRACMLKFVCPTRASNQHDSSTRLTQAPRLRSPPAALEKTCSAISERPSRTHRDSESTVRDISPKSFPDSPTVFRSRQAISINHLDLRRSEATRFHEFASSVDEVDEWIYESTVHRHKMTISDTLKKENAIRKLGEEAEEEALQDEEEGENDEDDEDDEEDNEDDDEEDNVEDDEGEEDDQDDQDDQDDRSDPGNETDNEEGFADSDDESDTRSDYQFWTPRCLNVATSTDHIEHIRSTVPRVASDSSLEFTSRGDHTKSAQAASLSKARKSIRRPKIRPGTPDLPDSTDFVCGTLDEDRPLEQAYVSCLNERRRSKHTVIPQDIDPSFPASDPEDDEEDDDQHSEDNLWIKGQLDNFDEGAGRHGSSHFNSPKRIKSPVPAKRGVIHRSPPPRRLFGRSPPPARRYKTSPPSRRTSLAISPKSKIHGIDFAPLSRRPNLTHTKSLPRHSNPFMQRFDTRLSGLDEDEFTGDAPGRFDPCSKEPHNRGAIDIVKGLENKRQRRKEKLMLKHCRNHCKDKWRKPQPGKGAERMRELGLGMAGKGKGVPERTEVQYMLSI